jgi:hypothetical protein
MRLLSPLLLCLLSPLLPGSLTLSPSLLLLLGEPSQLRIHREGHERSEGAQVVLARLVREGAVVVVVEQEVAGARTDVVLRLAELRLHPREGEAGVVVVVVDGIGFLLRVESLHARSSEHLRQISILDRYNARLAILVRDYTPMPNDQRRHLLGQSGSR